MTEAVTAITHAVLVISDLAVPKSATAIANAVQVIDLGDDMEFTLLPAGSSSDVLVCSDPTIPHDDSNLVIKVGACSWLLGPRCGHVSVCVDVYVLPLASAAQ